MAVFAKSSICELSDAPDDAASLLAHWQNLCGTRKQPARREIDPAQLRPYLGFLCILDVRDQPEDFIFRLFGTGISDFMNMDLTGRSVRDFQPAELGERIFTQIKDVVEAGRPALYRMEVSRDKPPRTTASYRLLLPLSDDGTAIDHVLTYTRFDAMPPDFWSRINPS